MSKIFCSYCGRLAKLLTINDRSYWSCSPCDARVGCHPGTTVPLGTLADAELRLRRLDAHAAFDARWIDNRKTTRLAEYAWLAKAMGLTAQQCHIGLFEIDQCQRVVELCIVAMFEDIT